MESVSRSHFKQQYRLIYGGHDEADYAKFGI